jgi:hypothetical protein
VRDAGTCSELVQRLYVNDWCRQLVHDSVHTGVGQVGTELLASFDGECYCCRQSFNDLLRQSRGRVRDVGEEHQGGTL